MVGCWHGYLSGRDADLHMFSCLAEFMYVCMYVCMYVYVCDLVDEADIIELEKQYWSLKGTSKSGRFDVETLTAVVSPPMPQQLCEGLGLICLGGCI